MKSGSNFKLLILSSTLFFGTTLQVQAMSMTDLDKIIVKNGIDNGVESALIAGMDVEKILLTSMQIDGLNPRNILVALCRAGANAIDMRKAAMSQNISPVIFANAMDTCESGLEEETQAYTLAQKDKGKKTDPNPPVPPEPISPSIF